MDELTRGTRCAKDLVGRDNSGFTVKGLMRLKTDKTFTEYGYQGRYYCLRVLTAASFNCSDGQKMSKRKKNYPDPMDIVSKYGADAIR